MLSLSGLWDGAREYMAQTKGWFRLCDRPSPVRYSATTGCPTRRTPGWSVPGQAPPATRAAKLRLTSAYAPTRAAITVAIYWFRLTSDALACAAASSFKSSGSRRGKLLILLFSTSGGSAPTKPATHPRRLAGVGHKWPMTVPCWPVHISTMSISSYAWLVPTGWVMLHPALPLLPESGEASSISKDARSP